MKTPPSLHADTVHFAYRGRAVLDGVSLTLGHGEVVSLLGANGTGKSTLLHLLLGLKIPQRGAVKLGHLDVGKLARRQLSRHLAYVPQAHTSPFPYTVRQVATMGRLGLTGLLRAPSRADRARVAEILEETGIAHLADRPYTEVSGGERQLALIARALAQDARILLLDEPATGLDYGHQIRLLERLQKLARSGYGVLMTTHHPDHALAVSNRVVLLKGGRILGHGAPGDVITAEAIQALYGIDLKHCRAYTAGLSAIATKEPPDAPGAP